MKSICLIIPYFGTWPEWFPLFLESCRYNPTIDWHFFTDCGEAGNSYPNIKFTHISYPDYQQLISHRLHIAFTGNPYKLCDLKPSLGYIHRAELESYDCFGFGDIDVIYGNLRKFLTPDVLDKKLVSTHADRVSGHFCLMENTGEMRNAFRKIPGWESLLETGKHQGIDESCFTRVFIKHRKHPEWIKRLSPQYRSCVFREQYSTVMSHKYPWIDGSHRYPETWRWDRGCLTAGGREMMYLHFTNWKSGRWHRRDGIPGTTCWEQLERIVQITNPHPDRFQIDRKQAFTPLPA